MLPELMAPPTSNNVVHSPAASPPRATTTTATRSAPAPFVLKSWTAGDRIVVERTRTTGTRASPSSTGSCSGRCPTQSRFASLQSGEGDIIWDDDFDHDNIVKATGDKRLSVHTHVRLGRVGVRVQHQGRSIRRRARAPSPGDGHRPQEVVAGDHRGLARPATQSLRRRLLGEVRRRRGTALRPGERRR